MRKLAILGLILGGCAGLAPTYEPPKEPDFEATRSFKANLELIWGVVMPAVSKHGFSIKAADRDGGIIAAESESSTELYSLCNCPGGSTFIIAEKKASLNVVIRLMTDSTTEVQIDARYQGRNISPYIATEVWVPCPSNGGIENAIFAAIDERIKEGRD